MRLRRLPTRPPLCCPFQLVADAAAANTLAAAIQIAATETWSAPALVPSPGDWVGSLSGYGDVGYFLITAQANRTLSVAVTALDEDGTSVPSESKAEPVVGMWTLGDLQRHNSADSHHSPV